jgi:pectin methylesterase-like acyl-CoA thioesterase
LLALTVILSLTALQSTTVKAQPKTIVVPDEYLKINDAIDNANAGDTVFVKKGLYNQAVYVNKPITLMGEDSKQTIIHGVPYNSLNTYSIFVASNKVTITGFTLTGMENGIHIDNSRGLPID